MLHSQGEYLGSLLSYTNGEIVAQTTQELEKKKLKPFKYHHLGSFAYVGDNRAVLQLPIIGITLYLYMYMYMYMCPHYIFLRKMWCASLSYMYVHVYTVLWNLLIQDTLKSGHLSVLRVADVPLFTYATMKNVHSSTNK